MSCFQSHGSWFGSPGFTVRLHPTPDAGAELAELAELAKLGSEDRVASMDGTSQFSKRMLRRDAKPSKPIKIYSMFKSRLSEPINGMAT